MLIVVLNGVLYKIRVKITPMLRLKNTSFYVCIVSLLVSGFAVADTESWIDRNLPQSSELKEEILKIKENRSKNNSFEASQGNSPLIEAIGNQIESLKALRRQLSKQKQPNKAQLKAIDQQITRLKGQQKAIKKGSKR
jgi:sensor histidine kinase YesM